jgi:hypothetical protein
MGSVTAALIDDDRFPLINAFDFVAFPQDSLTCQAVVKTNLARDVDRTKASVNCVRVCLRGDAAGDVKAVLGKVPKGSHTFLVVGTYLPPSVTCTNDCRGPDRSHVIGTPLALGCEERTVEAGKGVRFEIPLVPWRDPPPVSP